jgi:hypothetical protein
MTFDLPNESCAGQREEVPDKGYSTGYFKRSFSALPMSSLPCERKTAGEGAAIAGAGAAILAFSCFHH